MLLGVSLNSGARHDFSGQRRLTLSQVLACLQGLFEGLLDPVEQGLGANLVDVLSLGDDDAGCVCLFLVFVLQLQYAPALLDEVEPPLSLSVSSPEDVIRA